jgi:dolichyl-phosphate-mannose--protein O-mannosyl transferase
MQPKLELSTALPGAAASDRWRRQALFGTQIAAWLVVIVLAALTLVAAEAFVWRGQSLATLEATDLEAGSPLALVRFALVH